MLLRTLLIRLFVRYEMYMSQLLLLNNNLSPLLVPYLVPLILLELILVPPLTPEECPFQLQHNRLLLLVVRAFVCPLKPLFGAFIHFLLRRLLLHLLLLPLVSRPLWKMMSLLLLPLFHCRLPLPPLMLAQAGDYVMVSLHPLPSLLSLKMSILLLLVLLLLQIMQ